MTVTSHSRTVHDMPSDGNKRFAPARPAVVSPAAAPRVKQPSYVAPRLAGSPAAHSSPELGRDARHPSSRTPNLASKEEIATPVKTFLSSNVTPRSGSRKSRIDSASSTPTSTPSGTPTSSRPTSLFTAKEQVGGVLRDLDGLALLEATQKSHGRSGSVISVGKTSLVSFRGNSPERPSQEQTNSMPPMANNPPMFFHASDAKSLPLNTLPTQPRKQGFIYANGDAESNHVTSSPNLLQNDSQHTNLFSANGAANSKPQQSKKQRSVVSSVISSVKQPTSQTTPKLVRPRSTSPLKQFEAPKDQLLTRVAQSSCAERKSPNLDTRLPAVPGSPSTRARRSSLKSASGVSIPTRRRTTTSTDSNSARSSLIGVDNAPLPNPLEVVTDRQSLEVEAPRMVVRAQPSTICLSPTSPLVSPTRPNIGLQGVESNIDRANVLAADARRERKVLDLEISNSSLLAINRTLEREMRKQKAELRRYRRLTSTGRLSIAPSNRSISGPFSVISEADEGSGVSEEDEGVYSDLDLISDNDDDESSAQSSEPMSPSTQAAHDARQRAKDEKRLQLDLTKHYELLMDSQRMNQSLKRCLGWTEELIHEGRKALSYQVRVSDIEIGGRVLVEDETDEDMSQRKGLLSPAIETDGLLWQHDTAQSPIVPRLEDRSG